MTVTGRKPGGRYSPEQQQEDLSERQFGERCAELGWPCDRLGRDLGEDLNVRIYDEGASSGLSFLVQLKSTADSAALKRKRSPTLAYELEVKDLLHWEVSATLVVLVVWDVKLRTGWWRPIPEIIKDLDATTKGWRKKKTAAVSVPLENTTDNVGLAGLRRTVADHNLPIVPKSRVTTFSLIFDKSEAGIAAFRDFKRAVEMDEPLLLANEFAPKIKFPEWHQRIYGLAPVIQLSKLEKGKASLSNETIALRIEVASPEGYAEYPYVELRPVIQGTKRLVFTNEHQSLPFVFRLDFDLGEERLEFGFKKKRSGSNVYEARGAATFLVSVAAPGATIRITDTSGNQLVRSFPAPQSSEPHDLQDMRRWRDILDKLWYVQQKILEVGAFQLKDTCEFTPTEVSWIEILFEICRTGRIETSMSISFEIPPGFEERSPMVTLHRGSSVTLLDVKIPLGDMRVTVLDQALVTDAVDRARSEANASGKSAMVSLKDLRVVQEYVAWLPGKLPWTAMYETLDKLTQIAGHCEGYFTRADARTAGATDAIFDAFVSERKIEQAAFDVFHLNHFARSDDEQLISLWLQTDRQGVLSHETALLLHELSDILPRRLHIMVPPGFDPGARRFDRSVELLRGDVADDEKCWLGPVPYTSALRTLRDCIDIGVSPDLIEQAIEEGLERGLFTEDQIPVTVPAKYAREVHLAEKLHAFTALRSRENTRVKDLPDIALLALTGPFESHAVRAAIRSTFDARAVHPLPAAVPLPPQSWRVPYARMAQENGLRWASLDEITEAARAFLDPVLRGDDGTWDPATWTWCRGE